MTATTENKVQYKNASQALVGHLLTDSRHGFTDEAVKDIFEDFPDTWKAVPSYEDAKVMILSELYFADFDDDTPFTKVFDEEEAFAFQLNDPEAEANGEPIPLVKLSQIESRLDDALRFAYGKGIYPDRDEHFKNSQPLFMTLAPTEENIAKSISEMYDAYQNNPELFEAQLAFLRQERTAAKELGVQEPAPHAALSQTTEADASPFGPESPAKDMKAAVESGYSFLLAKTFDETVKNPEFIKALAEADALPSGSVYNDPIVMKAMTDQVTVEDVRDAVISTLKQGMAADKKNPFNGACKAMAERMAVWQTLANPDSDYTVGIFQGHPDFNEAFSKLLYETVSKPIFSPEDEKKIEAKVNKKLEEKQTKNPAVTQVLDREEIDNRQQQQDSQNPEQQQTQQDSQSHQQQPEQQTQQVQQGPTQQQQRLTLDNLFDTHPYVASGLTLGKVLGSFAIKTTKSVFNDIKYFYQGMKQGGFKYPVDVIGRSLNLTIDIIGNHARNVRDSLVNKIREAGRNITSQSQQEEQVSVGLGE